MRVRIYGMSCNLASVGSEAPSHLTLVRLLACKRNLVFRGFRIYISSLVFYV